MLNNIHNPDCITGFSDDCNRKIRMAVAPLSSINCIMSIGDRIRKAREAAGLSQEGLGERVGRSQSAVAEWETHESAPRRAVMEKLAEVLNVDLAWLELGDAHPGSRQELAINVGQLTESQLFEALGPILRELSVAEENWPVASRALLKAIRAGQSQRLAKAVSRFQVAGEIYAEEVQREILPPKRK